MVHVLLDKLLDMFESQPYLCALYRAMIVAAYYGMLRVGEIMNSQHVIKAKDTHVACNKDKMMFVLHTSKMHWLDSPPQIIKISARRTVAGKKSKNYCPFTALRTYLDCRKSYKTMTEPLFMFHDRTPVSTLQFRKTSKLSISLAGFDGLLYDTHSLCAGRSCDLLKMKVSVETIKKLGRWKSNAVFKYLKMAYVNH